MALKTPALLCLAAATLMAGCASTSDVDDVRRQLADRDRMSQQRLAQIESKISNEKLLEMVTQVEQLNAEVARLRGDLDVVNYNQQTLQKRQNDLYSDLDLRLAKLEGSATQAKAAAPTPANSETDTSKITAKTAEAKPVDEATQEYDRALGLLRNRDFAKAITALKSFNDKYPDARQQGDAHYWLGMAYAAERQCKPAISVHTEFVSKYASHAKAPDALRNIGNCQRDLGDMTAARTTWARLIKQFPNSDAAGKAKQQMAALKEG